MSNYETSGPGGVGKRYGAYNPGGVGGKIGGVDASQQVQFMLQAGEDAGLAGQGVFIPANSRITKIESLVIVANNDGSSPTVDVHLDGTTVLAAGNVITDATAMTYVDEGLTATVANLVTAADTSEELLVVPDANHLAGTAGECVITVTYTTA